MYGWEGRALAVVRTEADIGKTRDLIGIGIDALNPVQYSCSGMGLKDLRRDFGRDITFRGRGIDTQYALPFSTPDQVADEVRRNIDILAPGGGFVFTTAHNMVRGVPADNVLAAFQAAREHGWYRIGVGSLRRRIRRRSGRVKTGPGRRFRPGPVVFQASSVIRPGRPCP